MAIHNSFGIYRSSSTKWSDSHTNKTKDLSLTRERHNKSKTIKKSNNGNSYDNPSSSY